MSIQEFVDVSLLVICFGLLTLVTWSLLGLMNMFESESKSKQGIELTEVVVQVWFNCLEISIYNCC